MHSMRNVFEDPDLAGNSDAVIRPGGFVLTRCMVEACGLVAGDRIIDVGCGTGMTVDFLRREFRLDAVGTDISESMIHSGTERSPGLPLILGSGKQLPFESETADAILAECSLSVMADTDAVLTEMYRVLKPGGKLAVSDVYIRYAEGADSLRKQVHGGCFYNAMTQDEIASKLDASGYQINYWEDRTDLWRRYIAELIMGNCTVQKLWSAVSDEPDTGGCMSNALAKARPGYFWMMAEKR